jgi:hypothetical protein
MWREELLQAIRARDDRMRGEQLEIVVQGTLFELTTVVCTISAHTLTMINCNVTANYGGTNETQIRFDARCKFFLPFSAVLTNVILVFAQFSIKSIKILLYALTLQPFC